MNREAFRYSVVNQEGTAGLETKTDEIKSNKPLDKNGWTVFFPSGSWGQKSNQSTKFCMVHVAHLCKIVHHIKKLYSFSLWKKWNQITSREPAESFLFQWQ